MTKNPSSRFRMAPEVFAAEEAYLRAAEEFIAWGLLHPKEWLSLGVAPEVFPEGDLRGTARLISKALEEGQDPHAYVMREDAGFYTVLEALEKAHPFSLQAGHDLFLGLQRAKLQVDSATAFLNADMDGVRKAIAAMDRLQAQANEQVTIRTFSELLEMDFPENPLIDGLLDERESLLICGPSGLGKSVLTTNLALALAMAPVSGLWGKFAIPRPLRTVFIQSENTAKATHKRLRKIMDAAPELKSALDNISVPFLRNDLRFPGVLTDAAFEAQMLAILEASKADVLVLDPLISYHGEDENDNAAMRRSLDRLTVICDKANVACIVVHHVGKDMAKGGTFSGRGASAIGDWAANILLMSPVLDDNGERTNTIEMRHQKARNFEARPIFYLERTSDLHLVPTTDPKEKARKEKKQGALRPVFDALDSLGGRVEKKGDLVDAVAEITGKGRSSAQRLVKEALSDGYIRAFQVSKKQEGIELAQIGPKNDGPIKPFDFNV